MDAKRRFGEVAGKSVVVHMATYFVMGMVALFGFDNATLFEQPVLREYMRPLDDPLVTAGALFQPLRGLLFGVAFFAMRESAFWQARGWLRMWLVLVIVGIFSTFGPAPGSIEGIIYTRLPLEHHIGLGLIEVGTQALLLSLGLFFWVTRPELRWLRWTLLVVFVLALVLPAAGLLLLGTERNRRFKRHLRRQLRCFHDSIPCPSTLES